MRILLLIIFLLIVNCKFNKVIDNHGVHYLDKKQLSLTVNKSNKNDIIVLLGPPSTKSKFDNDLWIYIERKKTRTTLLKFGNKKIIKRSEKVSWEVKSLYNILFLVKCTKLL